MELLETLSPTVKPANISTFEALLVDAVRIYPNLSIVTDSYGIPLLKGVIDVPNDLGEIVGHFLVEIRCSRIFPFRFPLMYEVGGDIPQDADWHKNADGSCCITVWPEELRICKYGITISQFIREHAIPYLANQIYKKDTKEYKNGEHKHGKPGVFEYYFELKKEELQII